jgi:hypothetical protein
MHGQVPIPPQPLKERTPRGVGHRFEESNRQQFASLQNHNQMVIVCQAEPIGPWKTGWLVTPSGRVLELRAKRRKDERDRASNPGLNRGTQGDAPEHFQSLPKLQKRKGLFIGLRLAEKDPGTIKYEQRPAEPSGCSHW